MGPCVHPWASAGLIWQAVTQSIHVPLFCTCICPFWVLMHADLRTCMCRAMLVHLQGLCIHTYWLVCVHVEHEWFVRVHWMGLMYVHASGELECVHFEGFSLHAAVHLVQHLQLGAGWVACIQLAGNLCQDCLWPPADCKCCLKPGAAASCCSIEVQTLSQPVA